jgi:hypothetical protein
VVIILETPQLEKIIRGEKNMNVLFAIPVLMMALLLASCDVLPQTPQQAEAEDTVTYMFVQNAQSGSFAPVTGKENRYTLVLNGVAPQTIAFTGQPDKIVGQVPMLTFLDGMGFTVSRLQLSQGE